MTKIEIYDSDFEKLSAIAETNNITITELFGMIMDSAETDEICDTLELENPAWKGYDE